MSKTRSSLSCNLITTSGGAQEIIVVGGFGSGTNTVEIFNVNDRVWRDGETVIVLAFHSGMKFQHIIHCGHLNISGNNFPRNILKHDSVHFYDSFLIVGGGSSVAIYL